MIERLLSALSPGSGGGPVCPETGNGHGYETLEGERFCDQCGGELSYRWRLLRADAVSH